MRESRSGAKVFRWKQYLASKMNMIIEGEGLALWLKGSLAGTFAKDVEFGGWIIL